MRLRYNAKTKYRTRKRESYYQLCPINYCSGCPLHFSSSSIFSLYLIGNLFFAYLRKRELTERLALPSAAHMRREGQVSLHVQHTVPGCGQPQWSQGIGSF